MKRKNQVLKFLQDNRTMINSLMSKQEIKAFGNDDPVSILIDEVKKNIESEK